MPGPDPPDFDDEEVTNVTLAVPTGVGRETMTAIAGEFQRQVKEAKARKAAGLSTGVTDDNDDQLIALVREQLQGDREDRKHQRAAETRRFYLLIGAVMAVVMVLGGMVGVYLWFESPTGIKAGSSPEGQPEIHQEN
jgi:hypothetical protein